MYQQIKNANSQYKITNPIHFLPDFCTLKLKFFFTLYFTITKTRVDLRVPFFSTSTRTIISDIASKQCISLAILSVVPMKNLRFNLIIMTNMRCTKEIVFSTTIKLLLITSFITQVDHPKSEKSKKLI